MPNLRDLLKKRERLARDATAPAPTPAPASGFPRIVRTTTDSEEPVQPPDADTRSPAASPVPSPPRRPHLSLSLRRASHSRPDADAAPASAAAAPHERRLSARLGLRGRRDRASSTGDVGGDALRPHGENRLSARLGLRSRSRSRTPSADSPRVPRDLPAEPAGLPGAGAAEAETLAAWEKRATMLVAASGAGAGGDGLVVGGDAGGEDDALMGGEDDDTIQEAIRLHEAGELGRSTAMLGRLAPRNVLAQVLFGLAQRHGWGVEVDAAAGLRSLERAAARAAEMETAAETGGPAGPARGELVLAIYELANCFRHGWGTGRDPVAARQYYETAARLGDADAMEEAAWCLLEGFGGGKDKVCLRRRILSGGGVLLTPGAVQSRAVPPAGGGKGAFAGGE